MTGRTPAERAALRALAEAATPGPWLAVTGSGPKRRKQQYAVIGKADLRGQGAAGAIAVFAGLNEHRADDADFCVAARTAVPALLDEIERLRDGMESLVNDLRRYADPHDLSDPANPRHVSVGLMATRLKALLQDGTP
jgi:hypothetical protein